MSLKVKIKTFGVAREIMGGKEVIVEVPQHKVSSLRQTLLEQFPQLKELNSIMIAVNSAYAEEDQLLQETDEIALIPPVSGG